MMVWLRRIVEEAKHYNVVILYLLSTYE
uniref:Uncharacterized protein n=1 Tax=Arundo donax TaxID=35708 RepID=A0A0A9HCY5_ARUDO